MMSDRRLDPEVKQPVQGITRRLLSGAADHRERLVPHKCSVKRTKPHSDFLKILSSEAALAPQSSQIG
jgi:hypothetical protein